MAIAKTSVPRSSYLVSHSTMLARYFLGPRMRFTSFSQTIRIIGLTTIITAVAGVFVQHTAQAQFASWGNAYMPCSEAYFSDLDFTYSLQGSLEFLERLKQHGQFEAYEQALRPVLAEMDAINASVEIFAVELDAPIGYVANTVDVTPVEIPPEIERSIQEDMSYPYSREKVRMLNEKYGQYATFGQQITLVYSSAQTLRMHELIRERNAIAVSYLTPEEKQEYRSWSSSREHCAVNTGFADMGIGTITIEVGQRPDLDSRLREDTTGAIFFR